MTDAQHRYSLGLRAGYCGGGVSVDYADDDVYRLGYRRGAEDYARRFAAFLAPPDHPSQHGHELWPSAEVTALFGPSSLSDTDHRRNDT